MEYSLIQQEKNLAVINALTENYGLTLTADDMALLAENREEALKISARVDFSDGLLKDIAREFCDSSYIEQDDYARTLSDLVDCFYASKTESGETVSDAELLAWMRRDFEECGGSVEALQDKMLEICRRMRLGDAL